MAPSRSGPKSRLLDPETAGEIYGLRPEYLRRLARQGVIPSVKLHNKLVRFEQADLEEWIEASRRPALP